MILILFALFLLTFIYESHATIICVDQQAKVQGKGSGRCWSDPFLDLQDALNLARQDPKIESIWLAKGVYRPTKTYSPVNNQGKESPAGAMALEAFNPGKTTKGQRKSYSDHKEYFNHRLKTFHLVDKVNLIGGFEGQPNKTSPKHHATVLDGLLNEEGNLSDRVWHVLVAGNDLTYEGVELEISNLTIRHGYAFDAPYFPTNFPLRNNQQPRHYHDDGAGLYIFTQSKIKLTNVTFDNNVAVSGGAIFIHDGSSLILDHCQFHNNKAKEGANLTIRGGGPNTKTNPKPLTEVIWIGTPKLKKQLTKGSIFVSDNYSEWTLAPRARIEYRLGE